ncbi:MAG: response regulator [Thermodesulfobacteriota bacterium]|nr:response regulator [Thermodesulfobacteriota bacterium]
MVCKENKEKLKTKMDNLKILVVDDDPVNLKLVKKRLQKEKYDVTTAKSGSEAIKLLLEVFFDVVITDLMMPEVDGIGVLETINEKCHQTEVVIMTAYATVKNAVMAMKMGAADYLEKPINFDELFIRLQKIATLKFLAKDADDLREAMSVTEENANSTIQNLEMVTSRLSDSCSRARSLLINKDIEINKRVNLTLEILSSYA